MKFVHKIVSPNYPHVLELLNELNSTLKKITSDTGESSFSADTFDPQFDVCIVVYNKNKPVACGMFRKHKKSVCELKRMYSSYKGAGNYLIIQLELYAKSMGYKIAILSTRRVNTIALSFYQRQAYKECKAYGKYINNNKSICLSKVL